MTRNSLSTCPTPIWIRHWHWVGNACIKLLKYLALFTVLIYRSIGAVHMGGSCRFEPSCSCYAQEALQRLPFWVAFKLIIKRLAKCRPGGSFGYDPVPSAEDQVILAKEGNIS